MSSDDDGALDAAWDDLIEWARRGDCEPIASQLRADNMPLSHNARYFLADWIEGKVKRPQGKPAKRPVRTWVIDGKSQFLFVDRQAARKAEIKRWMKENKPQYRRSADLLEAAAKHFKMNEDYLNNMVRRSSKRAART